MSRPETDTVALYTHKTDTKICRYKDTRLPLGNEGRGLTVYILMSINELFDYLYVFTYLLLLLVLLDGSVAGIELQVELREERETAVGAPERDGKSRGSSKQLASACCKEISTQTKLTGW